MGKDCERDGESVWESGDKVRVRNRRRMSKKEKEKSRRIKCESKLEKE